MVAVLRFDILIQNWRKFVLKGPTKKKISIGSDKGLAPISIGNMET